MHLFGLTLAQFGACLAIGVAVVAALYALKARRRTVVVSFAPLWEQVTADSRRTSLFRRLRRILSFLLQVAFVTLVLLAIARPRLGGGAERERRFVVVLDGGASMQARLDKDADRTRFDEAKGLARDLLGRVGAEDRVMIVCAGLVPEAVTAFEADRRKLLDAVELLHPCDATSDLDEAVQFAAQLAGRADRVVVLTDRADVAVPHGVRWRRVGKPLDNVAITKFAARALSESPGEYEIFYEVANFGRAPADVRLKIETVSARPATLDERPLTLEPGARVRDVLHSLAPEDTTLIAQLTAQDGRPWRDALALDDVAEVALRAPRVARVLVVGAPDFFLDAALRSDPFVAVSRVAPANYAGPRDANVVIFDGADPASVPERAILIHSVPAASAVMKDVFVDRVDEAHPVMRFVGPLRDVNIARARALEPEPGDTVLASCAGAAVMVARERGNSRRVEIGFDLNESDLPLRVAFPKIVRNAVRWAAVGESPDASAVSGTSRDDAVSDLYAAPPTPDSGAGEFSAERAGTGWDLWPALAAAALALTAFEWLSYHRRWTV